MCKSGQSLGSVLGLAVISFNLRFMLLSSALVVGATEELNGDAGVDEGKLGFVFVVIVAVWEAGVFKSRGITAIGALNVGVGVV